jgi:hypothetical protein
MRPSIRAKHSRQDYRCAQTEPAECPLFGRNPGRSRHRASRSQLDL